MVSIVAKRPASTASTYHLTVRGEEIRGLVASLSEVAGQWLQSQRPYKRSRAIREALKAYIKAKERGSDRP